MRRPQSAAYPSPRVGYVLPMPPMGGSSVSGSPRVSPRSFRPGSAPVRPQSAAVRGGGRLYVQSPLVGMNESEMINEARIRLEHNKQRQKLKGLLATSANGGTLINTRDLLLACRIAKLDVGTENHHEVDTFVHPNHIARRDCYGTPREVQWKGFHKSIAYPEMHAPGEFPGELPLTRQQRKQYREYQEQLQASDVNAVDGDGDGGQDLMAANVRDQDVQHYHKILKRALETRFAEIRRAFRLIDEDNSGECSREELKYMLQAMFNLSIPEPILDRIIDLADYDGDGQINFAEFARLATEDDVLNMKNTLTADVSGFGTKDPQAVIRQIEINKQKLAAHRRAAAQGGYQDGGYHPKLRATGPGLDELRRAHKTLKKAITARYPDFKAAFKSIDKDGSGTLRRAELRRFLHNMVKTIQDRVITGLIDFCDNDGDARSLSMDEFIKLMQADYLGSGGFDPNSKLRTGPRARA